MGDILRSQIANKGTADDKWNMIGSLVSKGEMAPQVTQYTLIQNGIGNLKYKMKMKLDHFLRTCI